jgi:uncharacterized RDD family membrane protein YckC
MTSARLAGFATRALGLILDIMLINAATVVAAWALGTIGLDASAAVIAGLAAAAWLALFSGYLLLFWTLTGQTPGMRSVRRLVGMYLSVLTLGVGFLLVLVDDRRRGLHDRLAGTLVIHAPAADRPAARAVV